MEKILDTLFFLFTFIHNFLIIVSQDYSARNPAFQDYSKISGDTLNNSYGSVIYSALVFRHGDRTPVAPYPTDPYINYPWPQGYGQLTNQGKLRLNKVGQYFKGRYASLTGVAYNRKKVKANSGDVDRCLQSTESFLSGYFPPTPPEIWDPYIYWQPIPIHTTAKQYDNIIEMSEKCPLYDQLSANFYRTNPTLKNLCQQYNSLINYIARNAGVTLLPCTQSTYTILRLIYDTLLVEKTQFNLTLPQWTDAIFPQPLTSLISQISDIEVSDPEIKRLRTGPFLQQLISEMKQTLNKSSTNTPALHLFGAHDSNLIVFLRTFNVYNNVLPAYASGLAFELREKSGQHYVTLIYENATETAPYLINLPGCGGRQCTLQEFENITASFIPQNWESECNSNGTSRTNNTQTPRPQPSQQKTSPRPSSSTTSQTGQYTSSNLPQTTSSTSNVPQTWTIPTNTPQNLPASQPPVASSPPTWQSTSNGSSGNTIPSWQSTRSANGAPPGYQVPGSSAPSGWQTLGSSESIWPPSSIWQSPPIGLNIADDITFSKHGNMSFTI